jgi:hypothetical protein
MRDEKWLFSKLDYVWDQYFPDISQDNNVKIIWGRRARSRLGSIKPGESVSGQHPETIITINALFKDSKIPEYVVLGTIAHELSHYAHGFNSPIDRKFATPHAGGVVTRELRERGLSEIYRMQKKWLKDNWRGYVMLKLPPNPQKKRKHRIFVRWI